MPEFLSRQNIKRDSEHIQYYSASRFREAAHPFCGATSRTPAHKYIDKRWQDNPQTERSVRHRVRSQIDLCENSACSHHDFVERLPEFAEDRRRRAQNPPVLALRYRRGRRVAWRSVASPSHDHGHRPAVYDGEVLVIAKKFDLLIGHPLDPLPAFPGKENAWD